MLEPTTWFSELTKKELLQGVGRGSLSSLARDVNGKFLAPGVATGKTWCWNSWYIPDLVLDGLPGGLPVGILPIGSEFENLRNNFPWVSHRPEGKHDSETTICQRTQASEPPGAVATPTPFQNQRWMKIQRSLGSVLLGIRDSVLSKTAVFVA